MVKLSKAGKLIHKMSCRSSCECGATDAFLEELLERMSSYKRQSHTWKSQLDQSKRTNANLNDRCTKAEANVARLEAYVEKLEDELTDVDLPETIMEDEPESGAPWVLDEERDSYFDGYGETWWEESDYQDDNEDGY